MSDQQVLTPVSIRDQVAAALRIGGRARVTVTSHSTGQHLTVKLAAKQRSDHGGWISRARVAGRVGVDQADVIFADGGDSAFGGWCGTLYLDRGEWRFPTSFDDPRGAQYVWAAQHIVSWALGSGSLEDQADIALAEECSVCGKGLTDPVSLSRGIGPECFGRVTGASHV